MEILTILFYAVLGLGPYLIAILALIVVPFLYLRAACALVARYAAFGWKTIGWSLGALTLALLLKPPVIHSKPAADLAHISAWSKAVVAGTERPAPPPERFDLMRTMFSLILEPPVFAYLVIIASLLMFRWLLQWQPSAPPETS